MVGLVITIAQRKGGAGKTTLATQFAVTWARRGARVAALDIDPQGSFSAWVDLRRARLGAKAIGFDFAALPGWRAAQWVDDRVGSVDLVVIDAPPHAETEIGQPSNSETCSETADGVTRESEGGNFQSALWGC